MPRDQKPVAGSHRTALRNARAVGKADPEDLAKIDAFAHAHRLTVVETSIPKRTVRLSGTVADLSQAFGVRLQKYKFKEVTYRGRTGPVYVPSELAEVVEGVFGLDNRPVAKP